MPTISSLLRQAQSARKKQQDYEDQVKSFEWNVSAKTIEDYIEYKSYLESRFSGTADPSEALTIQNKLVSTRRAYISNEIQRQSIGILEGTQNSQGKYNAMVDLHQSSVENGDYELAQSLRLQLDNLNRSIQSEQARGQSMAATMASAKALSIEDTIDYIKKERGFFTFQDAEGNQLAAPTLQELKSIYEDGGEEAFNQIAQQVAQINGQGGANIWDVALLAVEQIEKLYTDAAEMVGPNTSKGRSYLDKARDIQAGEAKFDFAPGFELSKSEINDAIDASRAGQQLYVPSQEDGKNTFVKSKVVDYVWGRDENGNYKLIDVRQEFGDDLSENSTSRIKVKNSKGETEYIDPKKAQEYLQARGFNVKTEDGKLRVGTTGDIGIPGVSAGTSFDAVIGRDGNIRLRSTDNRIFDLELSDTSYGIKEIKGEDDVSIFGERGLGQFGRATREGLDLIKRITGQDTVRTQPLQILQNAAGSFLQAGMMQDTTGVLDTARQTSEQLQKMRIQSAQNLNQVVIPQASFNLGATPTPNLNTTAVPKGAILRVQPIERLPELKVTNVAAPKVNVTPTTPQKPLSVTSAPTKSKVSVTSGSSNQRLSVR